MTFDPSKISFATLLARWSTTPGGRARVVLTSSDDQARIAAPVEKSADVGRASTGVEMLTE